MTTSSTHRKIDIQSAHDLSYLRNNLRRAARAKIDLNLPPSAAPDGEDVLRRKVEALVEEYINATYTLAAHNIAINGIDAPTSNPSAQEREQEEQEQVHYEPYDTALPTRLQALAQDIETETLWLSTQRRTGAATAAAQRADRLRAEGEWDARAWASAAEEGRASGAREGNAVDVNLDVKGGVGHEGAVKEAWEGALVGLEGLRDGLPATRARMERARRAVEVVDGKG